MRTRLLLILVLHLAVVFFFSRGAQAQSVVSDRISGKLLSASATLTEPGPVPVFTAPDTGFTIMTMLCSGPGSDRFDQPMTVSGNTIGNIVGVGISFCFRFRPGINIPQGEILSCSTDFGPATCTLIFVQSMD